MSDKGANRKLRAHKKSRRGCGNCKLRAVKCDETRPICKRCKSYSVICNYDKKLPELELSSNGVFHVSVLNDPSSAQETDVPKSIAPSLKQGLAASLESHASHDLSHYEFELLHRFQTRTVLAITTPRSLPVYQSSILKYAYSHPYLLHVVLTLTLLHDRHFSPTPFDTSLSATEAYHWGKGIELYSKALSTPIHPASRDPLWATAAFLGILAINYVEARTPEENWPFATPSSLDLNWLRMSEGKKEIWKDGKAFMEGSDFRILAIEQQGSYQPGLAYSSEKGLGALPPDLLAYFNLVEGSDLVENPYYASVYTLAQTWNTSSMTTIVVNYLFYITNMEPRYKRLLERKDPRAMLLLAYWNRMVAQTKHWVVFRRAVIECESICLYLEKIFLGDQGLQSLLEYPKGVWIYRDPEAVMAEARTYQYSTLHGNDSIRLLILHPGLPGSDIHCSLIHTTISHCHGNIFEHYTALSYVWGYVTERRTIYVDRMPLEITVNLFEALDDLRQEHQTFRVWADAICIDQSNLSERSYQVGLMRQIYSCAQFTIIYLGKSNHDIDEVMTASFDTRFDFRLRNIVTTQILSRPWFTRVWIYQELVLSAIPWVQCGRKRIRWEALYVGLFERTPALQDSEEGHRIEDASGVTEKEVKDPNGLGSPENPLIKVFSDMYAARKRTAGPPTLFSVLLSRRGFGVSDLRDLIYGHLAVAGLPSTTNIPPCPVVDYKRSVVDVFTDATRHMLLESENYDALLHVNVGDSTRRMKELPSWVPDWSLPSTAYLAPLPTSIFRSSSSFVHAVPQAIFPASTLCQIKLRRIGSVKRLSNELSLSMISELPAQATIETLRSMALIIKSSSFDQDALQLFHGSYSSAYFEAYRMFQRWLGGDDFMPSIPRNDGELRRDISQFWDYVVETESESCEDDKINTILEALISFALHRHLSFLEGRRVAVSNDDEAVDHAAVVVPTATCIGDVIFITEPSKLPRGDITLISPIT
ncbi:hypothetical protein EG329_013431 [Mollisiaceae sp. DMI_Dod_QoI]|nr:hypothetical protein EG329_013431 [Helotiales sp. DMI_Dod_QoI]